MTNRDRRSAAIVAAARRLFLDHGFERTTMDAIAGEAKVSKATLYVHWSDKLTLFRSLIDIEIAATDARIARVVDNHDAPIDQRLFEAALQFLRLVTAPSFVALLRVVIAESRRHPALGAAVRRLCTPPADSVFATLIQESYGRPLEPDQHHRLVDLFMGMMMGTAQMQRLLDPDFAIVDAELAARARFATDMFLDANACAKERADLVSGPKKPYGLVSRRVFGGEPKRRVP